MHNFSPIHLIVIIAIVVIGIGLIFRGEGSSPSPSPERAPAALSTESVVPAQPVDVAEIGKRADDLPPPLTRAEPTLVQYTLETREVVAEMAPGVTYKYWTYNGTVPGPFLRAREGDEVRITLIHGTESHGHSSLRLNRFETVAEAESFMGAQIAHAAGDHVDDGHAHGAGMDSHAAEGHSTHSVDLHAVTGPGGGAMLTQVGHDGPKTFQFRALNPGIYVYHCASPHIPTHIANGMYGMILVEPKEGMESVDREFYVMQSDFYTEGAFGEKGHQAFSLEKLLAEEPSYFAFNGRVGSLSGERAMKAKVGERVRMYVGVGSHVASNFHIIGEVIDELYTDGALTSEPLTNVQTTIVPPGGAVMLEFTVDVPGKYLLVDHSLTRSVDKGALAELIVEGEARPDIFRSVP